MKTPIKFLTENENPSRQLSITDGHKRFFLYSKGSKLVNIRLHLFTFISKAIDILEHGGN